MEIVPFEDYMCNNPEYYTKPSRRNGQCRLNGQVLKPLYRDDLLKGYKKRKKAKDVKFVSYILKSDSISFFHRFSRYKVDRFTSEYFEIRLGKLPKGAASGAHNLVYIQDKQICHIDYYTGYCGNVYEPRETPEFIMLDTNFHRDFSPYHDLLTFEIPFKKNKSTFTIGEIDSYMEIISNTQHTFDSISIKAFASVEGDSISNDILQRKRAKNISKIILRDQLKSIETTIETSTAWDQFYSQIGPNPKWKFLASLDRNELKDKINNEYSKELEPILAKERKATVKLHYTVDLDKKNFFFSLNRDFQAYTDSLKAPGLHVTRTHYLLNAINDLYGYYYKLVIEEIITPADLAAVTLPNSFEANTPLTEKFIQYGYIYNEAFKKNTTWVSQHQSLSKNLFQNRQKQLSYTFIYNSCFLSSQKLMLQANVTQDEVQAILDQLELLEKLYKTSPSGRLNIEKLMLNMNMLLLNKVFVNEPEGKSEDAQKCIEQLYDYYEEKGTITDSIAFELANMFVYYEDVNSAVQILKPYLDLDYVRAYVYPMYYRHPTSEGADIVYNKLTELPDIMGITSWCSMFLNECKIPFQAFDHEKLRDIFCKKCMMENAYIKSLRE